MLDDFLAFSKENNLIKKGDRILIGVSGGIDSVVLLDILSKIKDKLKLEIGITHVNYGLRTESDRDNEFVKDLAKEYEIPFFEKKVKLAGNNIEEKARDIRYTFFNDLLKQEKFDKVAVAHHKNDLVETFFLNLSRGSGLTGLVAMRPKNSNLIRPLLFATRKEIEVYTKEKRLNYVEDVTNKDLSIKRNLIRHKIIPKLETLNLDFVETLANEIEHLRDANDSFKEITEKNYKKIAKESTSSVTLSVSELNNLHTYLQSEILRRAIKHVNGDLRDISRKNIKDILRLSKAPCGTKKINLPKQLIVKRIYDRLEIRKEIKIPISKPKKVKLTLGQRTIFGGWELFLREENKKPKIKDKKIVFLDIQKTPTLLVRFRKPGDKINIGSGGKSIQNIFVDEKVPSEERENYPIVINEKDEIVWIPGIRVSSSYKTTTDKVLSIKATRREIEEK